MYCTDCTLEINNLDLFKCNNCSIMVHKECNLYSTDQVEQYKITSCDVCRCNCTYIPSCCLCNKSSGLLKQTDFNHKLAWAHRYCLKDKTAYYFNEGYYIYQLCTDKNCIKCVKTQMVNREDEGGEYDTISTQIKCEVCLQVIKDINMQHTTTTVFNNNINYSRCSVCLSWYHDKCEKDYCGINYINDNKHCIKCDQETQFIRCFMCLNRFGLMVACNSRSTYAHSLCILSFDTLFIKTKGGRVAYKFHSEKQQVLKEKKRKCCICNRVNEYTIECLSCRIRFHPYCGFKADFTIVKSSTAIEYKCSNAHLRYPKDTSNNTDKDFDYNVSAETTACSLAHNIIATTNLTSHNNTNAIINTNTNTNSNNNNKTSISINTSTSKISQKEITELSNTFLVPERIQRKWKYNIKSKNSNINTDVIDNSKSVTKFNWTQINKFYKNFTKEDISKVFPYSFYSNDQLYDLIRETSTQGIKTIDSLNSTDYVIANIKKNKTFYFILYKMLQMTKQQSKEDTFISNLSDKDLLSQYNTVMGNNNYEQINGNAPINSSNMFLSKKRNEPQPIISNDNNTQQIGFRSQFLRAFRLNSLSNKILLVEKQISNIKIDEDLSYVDKQIVQKKEMLKGVILTNIQMAKKISLNENLTYSSFDTLKAITSELTICKSRNNFRTLVKRLKEGIEDKSYCNLFYGDSPLRADQSQVIENTHEYYESESECCVCLSYCIYSSTHVIYCDACNVSVHLNCYGISTLPNSIFKCDLCISNSHSRIKDIHCIFCLHTHGAMKRIDKNYWAHITCVLISKYAQYDNYYLIEKPKWIKDYDRNVLNENKDNYCLICNQSKGETFKCINCLNNYHFFCAYFKGCKMSLENHTQNNADVNNNNNKKIILNILQCPNDSTDHWNASERQLQTKLRRLVYQKE